MADSTNGGPALAVAPTPGLGLSKRRYKDLTWRLDMELARRNVTVITEPKFMLRLDVLNSCSGTAADGGPLVERFHLQSDFANLKRLQGELQRALTELSAPHAQRLVRYIK